MILCSLCDHPDKFINFKSLRQRSFLIGVNERLVFPSFRFVAATDMDLRVEVEKGAFHQDLFHRLNLFLIIIVPPLRERKEVRLFYNLEVLLFKLCHSN